MPLVLNEPCCMTCGHPHSRGKCQCQTPARNEAELMNEVMAELSGDTLAELRVAVQKVTGEPVANFGIEEPLPEPNLNHVFGAPVGEREVDLLTNMLFDPTTAMPGTPCSAWTPSGA